MPYGNLVDFEGMVKGYGERANRYAEQRRLIKLALAARPARRPLAARVGAWMVRTGTALQARTGELIVVAAQPPAALGADRKPC